MEEWFILVTTDHGRDESGFNHGTKIPSNLSEKLIFVGSNIDLNREFTEKLEAPNNGENGIYAYPSIASITPTILK